MATTKETGCNNHAKIGIFSIKNTSHLSPSPITLRPSKPVVMIIKLLHRTNKEWKSTKLRELVKFRFRQS